MFARQSIAATAILNSYLGRNRHASLLCCLNTALIYELAVMFEVKYKDSICCRRLIVREGGAPSGQVGREREVREVGELNDSYMLFPERLVPRSTSAMGIWEHTSIDVKTFLTAPMLEGSKLSIWTGMSLRVVVPRTWPTSSLYFYTAEQRTISLPAKVGYQEKEKKTSRFCFVLFICSLSNLWCTFSCFCSPTPCLRGRARWEIKGGCEGLVAGIGVYGRLSLVTEKGNFTPDGTKFSPNVVPVIN